MGKILKAILFIIILGIIAVFVWGRSSIKDIKKNTEERENLNVVTRDEMVELYDDTVVFYN